jgi:hypothetical protein
MAKRKRRGRDHVSRFVKLEYWMLDCAAFAALSGGAVKLLLRIVQRYNGANNGRIGFSVREAEAALPCSPAFAVKLFRELQDAGFIAAVTKGGFSRKVRHATEWRLTWESTHDANGHPVALPDKPFMRRKPEAENQNTVSRHEA